MNIKAFVSGFSEAHKCFSPQFIMLQKFMNLHSAFMLLRLAIRCPLILSGLRDTNQRVPTETPSSTPASGCRGGCVVVPASQLRARQPTWKEATLIRKAAAGPCLLPLPPFCSGRAAGILHGRDSCNSWHRNPEPKRWRGATGPNIQRNPEADFGSVFLGGAPQETGKVLQSRYKLASFVPT